MLFHKPLVVLRHHIKVRFFSELAGVGLIFHMKQLERFVKPPLSYKFSYSGKALTRILQGKHYIANVFFILLLLKTNDIYPTFFSYLGTICYWGNTNFRGFLRVRKIAFSWWAITSVNNIMLNIQLCPMLCSTHGEFSSMVWKKEAWA